MTKAVARRRRCAPILVLVAIASLFASGAMAQTRTALVVGNNAYTHIGPLSNAVNDAAVVSEQLQKSGFKVIRVFDAKASDFQEAKRMFLASVANGGIGVFYFAGHGIQVEGRNFLLPVDFANATEAKFAQESISVPAFLDELERAKPRLSIVILDACRDNPFAKVPAQVATRGLSEVARPVPSGTLVLYSASSNQAALDALPNTRSRHGLFTGELLAAMREPGLEIRDLAQRVRFSVMEKAQSAGHLQVPALYDNLSPGAFFLSAPPKPAIVSAGPGLPRNIRLIVPFAANSPSDSVVRTMVPFLAKALARDITVENEIDVQGDKVAQIVAGAPKDGSVLLISNFATSARRLQASDNRLSPVGVLADTPLSIVVSERIQARTMSDLLNGAKAQRQRLRMAVPLKGSPAEMCGQQLQAKFGRDVIELVSVPGEGPAMAEVVNGKADLTCASTAPVRAMASQPNAKFRELAEIRSTGSPLVRKIQVEAAGQQGFDIVAPNWIGIFAPAGLPANVTQQISAAMAKLQSDPVFLQAIARFQAQPVSAEQATPDGLIRSLRLGLSLQR